MRLFPAALVNPSHYPTERRLEQETLGKYSRVVSPELAQCEALLSCVIEGVDKDKLFFRFTNVDPSDPSREFSFVLDLSSKIYRGMSIPLPSNLLSQFCCSPDVVPTPSHPTGTRRQSKRDTRHLCVYLGSTSGLLRPRLTDRLALLYRLYFIV